MDISAEPSVAERAALTIFHRRTERIILCWAWANRGAKAETLLNQHRWRSAGLIAVSYITATPRKTKPTGLIEP